VRSSIATAANSMRSATDLAALEGVGYDIWVAMDTEEVDGWRFRFAHGLTKRGNSVWPNGAGGLALDTKLEAAERWYAERGAPAIFHVSPAAQPASLAETLGERGYEDVGARTSVETAMLESITSLATHGDVHLSEELDDEWIAIWAESRGFDRLDVARSLLTGSPGRTAFARIDDVAVGRGVARAGWLGVTSMATLPRARGRGHARATLGALARWARAAGCTRALLQVDTTAAPARRLYARAGFAPRYEYRYLVST
jgi:GNAT superfamily N-acetyltransferase